MKKFLIHPVHGGTSYGVMKDLILELYFTHKDHLDISIFCNNEWFWLEFCYFTGIPIWNPKDGADFMLVDDPRGFTKISGAKVIQIGHGLGTKFFNDGKDTSPLDENSDYILLPSQWFADFYAPTLTTGKVFISGMPKLDRAFHERKFIGTRSIPAIRNDKTTVLIAPSFNPGYNCLEMIAPYLGMLTTEFRIIFKPHYHFFHSSDPGKKFWAEWFRNPPKGIEVLPEHHNLGDLLAIADVVVSDVSSAGVEAIALGIPTILVESAEMRRTKKRQMRERGRVTPEYFFQKYTQVIRHGIDLEYAIRNRNLFHPDIYEEDILEYRGESISRIVCDILPLII